MKKRGTALLLTLALLLGLLPTAAFAATAAGGQCGTDAVWTLDSAGTLTISGSGAMQDYTETDRPAWQKLGVKKVVVEQGITAIGKCAFAGMDSLTAVTLPRDLTEIRAWAFEDCDALAAVTLPDTVRFLGWEAFACCDALEELWLPDSVTTMSTGVFRGCTGLEAVYLSRGLKTIPTGTFQNCTGLRLVMMYPTTTIVEADAFAGCDGLEGLYWLGDAAQLQALEIRSGNEALGGKAQVYLAVVATRHPVNATTSDGGRAVTFTAEASRSDAQYRWYMLPPNGEKWVMAEGLSGCRTAALTVPTLAQYDGYQFTCHISVEAAGYGVMEAITDPALLTVVAGPTIVARPRSVKVYEGQQATVTLTARGTGLTYEWYYAESGSDTFRKTEAFTGNRYSVEMTKARAGRRIYCVITDQYGASVRTDTVLLAMHSDLTITAQPQSVVAGDGKPAAVTVKASGEELRYAWYWAPAGSDSFTLTESFTGNTYKVEMNAERSGRQVYCVVSDRYGNTVTSQTATLTMADRPVITVQPSNVTVQEGEMATVTFTARGEGLTYVWYSASYGSPTFYASSAFDGPTYTVEMNEARNNRRVYCEVTDQYGVTVRTDTVTLRMVSELKIVTQPTDGAAVLGEMATVTVEVKGDGLRYEWYYSDDGGISFRQTTAFTGPEYSVEMTEARNGRYLYCKIMDRYGQSVKTDVVMLRMEKLPLTITEQPQSVSAVKGEKATVTVGATGEGLTYAWYYSDDGGGKFYKTSAFTGPEYSVEMTESRDGRQLYCVVTDRYGSKAQTETVTLTMKAATLTITAQPQSVVAAKGTKATVTVKATGDGLKYQWYWANAGSEDFALTGSFTGNTYSVEMNADRNGRRVYCVITDKFGNKVQSDTATLTMAAVTITAQPEGVIVPKGQMATVTVEAEGEGLTYAWYYAESGSSKYYKTSAFTGPEYSVEMTAARNGRKLYCVVTDKFGNSAKTNTVTLRMGNALVITKQPTDVSAAKGSKATVTVKATGDGLQYRWYYAEKGSDSFTLTKTFTGSTYTVEMTKARDGRRVYCVVSDKFGREVRSDTVNLTMK